MPRRCAPHLALVLVLAGPLGACQVGPLPIEAEFDAVFAQGTVCLPSAAQTGTVPGQMVSVPVRFDLCLYRCLTLRAPKFKYAWACAAGNCELNLLAYDRVLRVDSEKGCDGRDIESPPADECEMKSIEFMMTPPFDGNADEWVSGPFSVQIPYLTLDDAEAVIAGLDAGKSVSEAVRDAVGVQRWPSRTFPVTFDPDNPAQTDPAALAGGDCHEIPLP